MPLINLVNETKLRSIPFGNDRPNGGDSAQPFIQRQLPGIDQESPKNNKDQLIRGGGPLTLRSAAIDFTRLAKFLLPVGVNLDFNKDQLFKDFEFSINSDLGTRSNITDSNGLQISDIRFSDPNDPSGTQNFIKNTRATWDVAGLLFTGKQNLLARTGVFIRDDFSRIYTPASTLANSLSNVFGFHFQKDGVNPLKGLLGGYYNLGSKSTGYYTTTYKDNNSTVSSTPSNITLTSNTGTTSGTKIEFDLNSNYFTPVEAKGIYGKPTNPKDSTKSNLVSLIPSDTSTIIKNKLTLLYQTKIFPYPVESKQNLANSLYSIPIGAEGSLMRYSGGPSSFLGIGQTNIRMSGIGYGFINENTFSEQLAGSLKSLLNDSQGVYVFNQGLLGSSGINRPSDSPYYINNNELAGGKKLSFLDFRQRLNDFNQASKSSKRKPFTYTDPLSNEKISKLTPQTNYSYFNRSSTYFQDIPATKKAQDYYSPNSSLLYDYINATAEITTGKYMGISTKLALTELGYKDLIKFNFEVIGQGGDDLSSHLFFRAYINSMTDNYKADWNQYKYVGRAENLYKYSSFNRDGQISFSVYAHSRAEMRFLYRKLNLLVATTAPNYSSVGLMRGSIVRINIGDYYNGVPVIINNISLKPNFDAGWDIDRDDNGLPFKRPDDGNIYNSLFSKTQDTVINDKGASEINQFDSTLTDININKTTGKTALYTGPQIDNGNLTSRGEWVGQLPRMIDIDMSFTVLHDFAPRYDASRNNINFIANKSTENSNLGSFSTIRDTPQSFLGTSLSPGTTVDTNSGIIEASPLPTPAFNNQYTTYYYNNP